MKRQLWCAFSVLVIAVAMAPLARAAETTGLKIYISVDMEGVVGAVTGDQLGPSGFEYGRYREFMTEEALAAVRAAKRAGASEILVSDSHGNGENLLIERFPRDVRIIRSWPRPLGMMAGIDESFDAVLLIGYHASTDNPKGVRAHTFSSARLTHVALNGTPVSEGAFNAAIAGHFGVPVVMVSGDDAAVAEVRSVIGDVEAAVVKRHLGFHSAETMTPAAAYDLIEAKVEAALARLDDFLPHKIDGPITLDVSFKHYRPVEVLAYLPIVERTDSHSIRFLGRNMIEVSNFRVFLLSYDSNSQP